MDEIPSLRGGFSNQWVLGGVKHENGFHHINLDVCLLQL